MLLSCHGGDVYALNVTADRSMHRYAHVQAQIGEKGERPWAEFEIDVSLAFFRLNAPSVGAVTYSEFFLRGAG